MTPTDELVGLCRSAFRLLRGLKRLTDHELLEPPLLAVLHCTQLLDSPRLSELTQQLHLDLSTTSRHVRALTDKGLLSRVEDPTDRRACRLSITPAGAEAVDRATRARAARLGEAIAHWSDQDRTALTQLMERLATDLENTTNGGVRT